MFKLNDDIVEQAPTVDQVFSDRGQAMIGNMDSIKEVNDELREQIRLELETQRLRNEANLKRNIEDYVDSAAASRRQRDGTRDGPVRT